MTAEADSEKTKAIKAINAQLQDVTETVRMIQCILEAEKAEKISRRQALYRILKESISLLFPEKKKGDQS